MGAPARQVLGRHDMKGGTVMTECSIAPRPVGVSPEEPKVEGVGLRPLRWWMQSAPRDARWTTCADCGDGHLLGRGGAIGVGVDQAQA